MFIDGSSVCSLTPSPDKQKIDQTTQRQKKPSPAQPNQAKPSQASAKASPVAFQILMARATTAPSCSRVFFPGEKRRKPNNHTSFNTHIIVIQTQSSKKEECERGAGERDREIDVGSFYDPEFDPEFDGINAIHYDRSVGIDGTIHYREFIKIDTLPDNPLQK
jgi:hypothetical protein